MGNQEALEICGYGGGGCRIIRPIRITNWQNYGHGKVSILK